MFKFTKEEEELADQLEDEVRQLIANYGERMEELQVPGWKIDGTILALLSSLLVQVSMYHKMDRESFVKNMGTTWDIESGESVSVPDTSILPHEDDSVKN